MYSAGSSGIIDASDTGKIVFSGSIAELSPNVAIGLNSAGEEPAIQIQQMSATIRYPVLDGFSGRPTAAGVMLAMRYRTGGGRIVATLTEVPVGLGAPHDPGTVAETAVLTYDSKGFASSNSFLVNHVTGGTDPGHVLDFTANCYYIDVVLTAPDNAVGVNPAVAAVGLLPAT